MGHVERDPDNANRWVARETLDDDTCDPCRNNNGKLYKNRQDAYADYPGGSGYVDCIGEEHGNACRGKVVKRRGGSNVMTPEQRAAIDMIRDRSGLFSAKAFTNVEGPTQGIRMEARADAAQLYIYDYIGGYDGVTAIDVVEALRGVTGDIDLHINSGGGSIFEGTAIHTTLSNYKAGTIRTQVDGVAASAASVIAMVGAPHAANNPGGKIEMAAAATMMIHAGSGGAWGTAKDLRAQADVLDLLTQSLSGTYAAVAGGTPESWLELMNSGDTWYNATQALEAKLATHITGKAAAEPDEDDDEPQPDAPEDVLAAFAASFTAADRKPRPTKTEPVPGMDLEGIRNAMKGIFA